LPATQSLAGIHFARFRKDLIELEFQREFLLMRVLLVGGLGYIGSSIASELRGRGHQVVLAGRGPNKEQSDSGNIVIWNATQEWVGSIPTVDVVVHLASANGVEVLDSLDTYLNNLAVTRNILELCTRISNVAVLYVSTLQVFGKWSGELSIDSPVKPVSEYGFSHWVAEEHVKMFARTQNRKSQIVRLSNVIGVGADPSTVRWGTVPAEFCLQAVQNRSITVKSNLNTQRDFISVKRVSRQLADLIENSKSWDGRVSLIASGVSATIGEVAGLVSQVAEQIIGVPVPINSELHLGGSKVEPKLRVICDNLSTDFASLPEELDLRSVVSDLIQSAIKRGN